MLEPAARLPKVTGHRVLARPERNGQEIGRIVPAHLGMIWMLGPGTGCFLRNQKQVGSALTSHSPTQAHLPLNSAQPVLHQYSPSLPNTVECISGLEEPSEGS